MSFIKKALCAMFLLLLVQCDKASVRGCKLTSVSQGYAACVDGRILALENNELRQVDSLMPDLNELQKTPGGYLFGRKPLKGASQICVSDSAGERCADLEDGGLVMDIFTESDTIYVGLENGRIFRGTTGALEKFALYSPEKEPRSECIFLEKGFDGCRFIGYYGAVTEVCPDSVRVMAVDVEHGESIQGALRLANGDLFVYGGKIAKMFRKGFSVMNAPFEISSSIIGVVERDGKIAALNGAGRVQVLDEATLAVQKEVTLRKKHWALMNSTQSLVAISQSGQAETVSLE